jgi:hypothetical protein
MQPVDPNSDSSTNPQSGSAFSRVSTGNRTNNDLAPQITQATQATHQYRTAPIVIVNSLSTCLPSSSGYFGYPQPMYPSGYFGYPQPMYPSGYPPPIHRGTLPSGPLRKRSRPDKSDSDSPPANREQIENFKKHLEKFLEKAYVDDLTTRFTLHSDFATEEIAKKIENLISNGVYNGSQNIRFEPNQIRKILDRSNKRASVVINFLSDPNHIKLLTTIYNFDNQNITDLINNSTAVLTQLTNVIYDPYIQYQYNRIIKCGFTPRNVIEILRKTFRNLPDTLKLLTDEETVVKLEELTKRFAKGGLGVSPATLSRDGFLDSSLLKVKERVNGFHKVYKDFFSRHSSKINSKNHRKITRLIEKYLYKNPRLIAKIQSDNTPIDYLDIGSKLDSLFNEYQIAQAQGSKSSDLPATASSTTTSKEADAQVDPIRISPAPQVQNPQPSLVSSDNLSSHIIPN